MKGFFFCNIVAILLFCCSGFTANAQSATVNGQTYSLTSQTEIRGDTLLTGFNFPLSNGSVTVDLLLIDGAGTYTISGNDLPEGELHLAGFFVYLGENLILLELEDEPELSDLTSIILHQPVQPWLAIEGFDRVFPFLLNGQIAACRSDGLAILYPRYPEACSQQIYLTIPALRATAQQFVCLAKNEVTTASVTLLGNTIPLVLHYPE